MVTTMNNNNTTQNTETVTLIKRAFLSSYLAAGGQMPTIVDETDFYVEFVLDPDSDGWIELASSADYHSDFTDDDDPEMRKLAKSALRTSNTLYELAVKYRKDNEDLGDPILRHFDALR